MKSKRFIAILTLLCCSSILFSGCGKKNDTEEVTTITDENVTAAGELPIVKEKITLTIGVPGSSFVEDYETNEYTKFLEEKTGIDLEFYEFPSSGGSEKLNVMLSSNTEFPDVVCGFNLARLTFLQYAKQGVILDLTKYMDEYGYWINEMKEQSAVENFDGWMTAANGAKYIMPTCNEQVGNQYGGKAFINKKWLDKLGLEMPKTWDELIAVCDAAVVAGETPFLLTYKDAWTALCPWNSMAPDLQPANFTDDRLANETTFVGTHEEIAEKYLTLLDYAQEDYMGLGYDDGK